ncbi:hypothetical protein AGMMS49546_26580 [Spirochaetia bacterium]|nr:hypothetical protein AGMMS49546_26580 [Spirochaetia bacterium]
MDGAFTMRTNLEFPAAGDKRSAGSGGRLYKLVSIGDAPSIRPYLNCFLDYVPLSK